MSSNQKNSGIKSTLELGPVIVFFAAYILFDRLITKAVRIRQEQEQGGTSPSPSPSNVALETSACQHMLNRHSQHDLANIHQQFLSDWREAEGLNLAMMPVMMSVLRALT